MEENAHVSQRIQDIRVRVTLAFLRETAPNASAALQLLDDLEPDDREDAAMHHEFCYFSEEVEAWAAHNIVPTLLREDAPIMRLRKREAFGSLYHTWPRSHSRAHYEPRSRLNPFPRLPSPCMPTHAERGFFEAVLMNTEHISEAQVAPVQAQSSHSSIHEPWRSWRVQG